MAVAKGYTRLDILKFVFVSCLLICIIVFYGYRSLWLGSDKNIRSIKLYRPPDNSSALRLASSNVRYVLEKLKADSRSRNLNRTLLTDDIESKLNHSIRLINSVQLSEHLQVPDIPNTDNTSPYFDTPTEFISELEKLINLRQNETAGLSLAEERKYNKDDQYKYYAHCPSTLRKKILEIPELRKKFIPDIPILLTSDHFNKEEYDRLSHFKTPQGWSNVDYKEVADVASNLNTDGSRYMFDNLVSKWKNTARCVRCAVVGNGGVLKNSKLGEEINSHDYVFRVNVAVTKGFESDVGDKTSHYVFTMVTLDNSIRGGNKYGYKSAPNGKDIRYVLVPCEQWSYQVIGAALSGKPLPRSQDGYSRSPPTFPVKLNNNNVKVLHPDFSRYLFWSWVDSPGRKRDIYRPQTGAFMLLVALHTCDEVDVYGVGASYSNYTDHYYDNGRHVEYANHDYTTENKLWARLNELGIINLHT
ncbi:alpha-N-acetylgalactosaminide alpha-2,6-sialyltransferase 2-like [Saccoglossus kowalevskii]|uniref:alpha-N-acetylgalactosaminide alpha-2,6-sialyltransferase n=1 Tax=Saccoglossus kowalevskii TaxID=10224 RepID=A0ABM0MY97_SACKO|nr:PREDICTED: alpha-N-acetylgalactosaminide alpha-2,6-sialyltransferase 2-like [Saccoglossus kowalevskii]